jgi:hypothetical protein
LRGHFKVRERVLAKGHGDGNIARVAAPTDDNAPDAMRVVARIEGVPAVTQIDLEPRAEIHGRAHAGHAASEVAERVEIRRHVYPRLHTGVIAKHISCWRSGFTLSVKTEALSADTAKAMSKPISMFKAMPSLFVLSEPLRPCAQAAAHQARAEARITF